LYEADVSGAVMLFIQIVVSAGAVLAADVMLPLNVLTPPAVVDSSDELNVVELRYVGEQPYP
jgi:hypothetical protein